MFLILYYDVNSKRCGKMLKICRKYLTWVQNSVFEGDISDSNFEKLQIELTNKMKDMDSVVIYKFRHMKYFERKVIGNDKKGDTQFL